ncbi:MAG: single-stranded DNA-binding protein [Myxococcales bacterium FL481]|nr:MAG: single-stranded DNA-binding protein [Myxococcales bacterium FL481]
MPCWRSLGFKSARKIRRPPATPLSCWTTRNRWSRSWTSCTGIGPRFCTRSMSLPPPDKAPNRRSPSTRFATLRFAPSTRWDKLSVNRATLLGKVAREPELRETRSGVPVCNLTVATSRKTVDRHTQRTMVETEMHRVTVWGKHAVHCHRHLRRGSQAFVEGRLRTTSYEGSDGVARTSTEIVADKVEFLRNDVDADELDETDVQG